MVVTIDSKSNNGTKPCFRLRMAVTGDAFSPS